MKYTLALGVLCAVPALAGDYPKYYDHKDFVISEVWHEDNGYNRGHHHHRPQKPHHPHPQKPHLEHYEKLTEKIVCEKLHFFAAEADYIYDLVKSIDCDDRNARCWEPVKKALYELEWELDLFDTKIDKSNLNKCWDCRQEGKIACCYRTVSVFFFFCFGVCFLDEGLIRTSAVCRGHHPPPEAHQVQERVPRGWN
jgi:hypothetical protein